MNNGSALTLGSLVALNPELLVASGVSRASNTEPPRAVVTATYEDNNLVEVVLLNAQDEPVPEYRWVVAAHSLKTTSTQMETPRLEALLRTKTKDAARHHFLVKHKAARRPFKVGDRVPYAGRVFDEHEIENLVDATLDFWLTAGRFSSQFEKEFAATLGVRSSLLVNSGSSANLVSFMSLTSPKLGDARIRKGDEVITVAASFPATVSPIIQYGAVPVFLDITLPTYNIDIRQLEEAYTPRTKAIMVAHTLGNPFDLKAITEFCKKHDLWLIEDNCDALGSEYTIDGATKLTGTFGDFGTSSFYPPHHLTMGEGGAVYTDSPKLASIAASFRDWGRDCWCASGEDNTCGKRFEWQLGSLPCGYDHKYTYSHLGYNLKATDMQAAIGVAQLSKLADFTRARRKNWQLLRDGLNDLADQFILPEATEHSNPSWFGFLLTLREPTGGHREKIINHLERSGIQTRMLFAGNLLRQPCCDDLREDPTSYRVIGDLANTDVVMNRTLWVGVYPGLTEDAINYTIQQIRSIARELTKPSQVSLAVTGK